VTAAIDLTLLPFYRIKGQEWAQLPGLLALKPPKRTARGRDEDRLILYLTLSGNTPLSSAEYDRTTSHLAHKFYQTPGSLTSAIRTTAEALNQDLENRNLRTTTKGQYTIGRLILGVLRDSQFIFAQCGPTHVFHIHNGEAHQLHDPQISGRGLGISQTTPLYFSQLDLNPGDQMLLCADLPLGWDEILLHERYVSPEALRQRLLTISGGDLNAIMVQARVGKGELNILKASPSDKASFQPQNQSRSASLPGSVKDGTRQPPVPASTQANAPARPGSQIDSEHPASRFTRILSGVEVPETEETPNAGDRSKSIDHPAGQGGQAAQVAVQQPNVRPVTVTKTPTSHSVSRSGRFVSPRNADGLPEIKRPSAHRRGIFRGLVKIIQGVRTGMHGFSESINKFFPTLLPGSKEAGSEIAGPSLAFFAIAIPLIVVTVAVLVYTRYGRVTQYQDNYSKALEQAALANGLADPADVRHAWDSTIYYLDQADNYQVTQDSLNLRQEAQTALDNLDSIVRLDFHQVIIGGLDRTVQISRMAVTSTDLYVLDAAHGSVIRASLGSQGYEVDASFVCGPGKYDTITVGNLIDIEALQMSNNYNARVLGIDAGGNLLYCGFNMDPVATTLSAPPLGWQNISAFSLDTDGKNLYILDPLGNNVWVYQGDFGEFTGLPTLFFGEQVPQDMKSSIDIAANNSDLYLLFSDGHVSSCPESHLLDNPLRCTDPVTFVDNRPERQPGPRINDAIFTQLTFTAAPDPLLYLLEPLTRAVYYFSPRASSLELRGQFRAGLDQVFNGPATAMTIGPNHYIFFSIGNQVFFATNAP
jgi:hypothetical protein